MYFQRGIKPLFLDDPRQAEPDWYSVEFEDDRDEWNEFYGTYTSQFGLLLTEVAYLYPELLVNFLAAKTHELFGFNVSASADATTVQRAERHAHFLQRAFSVVFEAIVTQYNQLQAASSPSSSSSSAPKVEVKGPSTKKDRATPISAYTAAIQSAFQLLSHFFTWNPAQEVLIREKLCIFGNCAALFTLPHAAGTLTHVLGALFDYVKTPKTSSASSARFKETAAETVATILHRCAKYIQDGSLLEQILQATSEILSVSSTAVDAQYSFAVQMAMRETMIVLSNHTTSLSMKQQLVDVSCNDIVSMVERYQRDVFPSVEHLVQGMQGMAPASIDAWFTQQLEGLRDMIVAFLTITRKADASALDARLFGPLYAAYKSSNSTVTSIAASGMNNEAIMACYPIAAHWMRFLQALRQLLPVLLQLTLSTTASPSALATQHLPPSIQMACRVNAKSDVYRLLGKKYTAADVVGFEVSEALRNLMTNVFKAFDVACRHRMLYLWGEAHRAFILQEFVPFYLPVMQAQHLSRALNYFLVAYSINLVPQQPADTELHVTYLLQSLECLDQRVRGLWQALQGVSGAVVWDDGLATGYAGLSQEEIASVRENRVKEISGQYADYLAEIVGLRGPLTPLPLGAVANNHVEIDGVTLEDKKAARRQMFVSLLLLEPAHQALSVRYLQSILLVLSLSDLHAFKQGLNIVNWVLGLVVSCYEPSTAHASQAEQQLQRQALRWESFLCGEVTAAVLKTLLMQEAWSMGLGWEMTDYLLEVLRVYVLLVPLDGSTGSGNGVKDKDSKEDSDSKLEAKAGAFKKSGGGKKSPMKPPQLLQPLHRKQNNLPIEVG